MQQVASNARRLARVFRQSPPIQLFSDQVHRPNFEADEASQSSLPWRSRYRSQQILSQYSRRYIMMPRASFCSGAGATEGETTEAVKDLYDKMLKSVKDQRTAPPNAWLWSIIENCAKGEDIKLLFDILEKLRRFRLSNLRIHENFNCNLCREIAKACARVGAVDFGKKTLWKHNVYGITPSIASAHHLLMYAKQINDANLMVEVMKLLKKNDLPLQSGTADIVFRICYSTDNWELIFKYSKRFIKAGVKLRQTSFDVWMEFAAKRGDIDNLWKIEKLRSETMKKHSFATAFSCAKGLLLERKPEGAAAIIHVLNENLVDAKKPGVLIELQKLVGEWSLEVIKHRKEEEQKALADALQTDIPAMINALLESGLKVDVNMEEMMRKDLL